MPLFTSPHDDISPSTTTLCFRFVKKDLIVQVPPQLFPLLSFIHMASIIVIVVAVVIVVVVVIVAVVVIVVAVVVVVVIVM